MPVLEERKRHAGLRDDVTVEEYKMDKVSKSSDEQNDRNKEFDIVLK